ncbi:hypothetical protein ACFOWM_12170 [Ferruginibacter yonginensis]|uniref:Uncharacterized protein n=1 Tax=Ferruginibacter yonginensis TaxID=1310416 RepID=A0ABV8QTY2_9BACT
MIKKLLFFLILIWVSTLTFAQSTYVAPVSEFMNFGTINLASSANQSWNTARTATPGYFSAYFPGAVYTAASDAANINGYMKKYGNEAFTFPVGSGTDLRSLSISAPTASTDVYATAWILGNPSTTPDPTNSNALHNVTAVAGSIKRVATIGQWDWQAISGSGNGLAITASMPNLSTFAPAGHLRLVGWDAATNKWIALGNMGSSSNVENTSIIGTMKSGIDAIGIGSIADGFPELTPSIDVDNSTFSANQTNDLIISLFEIANNPSDATPIQININVPSGWNITVPGITLTGTNQFGVSGISNVGGGTTHNNGDYLFRSAGSFITVTIPSPQTVTPNGLLTIGLIATRKPATTANTSQSLTASISTSTRGGDLLTTNNVIIQTLTAN